MTGPESHNSPPESVGSSRRGVLRILTLSVIPIIVAVVFVLSSRPAVLTNGVSGILSPPPRPVWGYVTDEYTGAPIVGAAVSSTGQFTQTDADGEYVIGVLPAGATLNFSAPGYDSVLTTLAGETNVSVFLRPKTFSGRLIDSASGKPVSGATVYYNGAVMTAAVSGTFRLDEVPKDFKLKVMAPGYKKLDTEVIKKKSLDIKLEPIVVKGLYFSFYTTGWDERRDKLLNLVDRTELNAVVFDVKGDYGYISYPTNVPLAKQIEAEKIMVKDMDAMVASLKKRNIYTIARIVVFKDDILGSKRPDWAVKTRSGGVYLDTEGLRWVDPFRGEVWEYNIAIAEEVARKGFDEIQFDYIRFPSDGSISGNVYSKQVTEETRVAAIAGFLSAARAKLKPLGVFVGADVFGWTMFREDDMGIGQHVEHIAPYVDYVCPMVYPSSWGPGSRGIDDPVGRPYDIVNQSTKYGIERLKNVPTVKIRPWLQDFDDYGPKKQRYGVEEIAAQKKAAADAGAIGWMFWNASANYTEAGYAPNGQ